MTTIRRLFPIPVVPGLFFGAMVCISSLSSIFVARTDAADEPATPGDFYCGPRCVQKVLRYYGISRDVYDLAPTASNGLVQSGASMPDLSRWLMGAGVHSVPVRLAGATARPWPGPVIAHIGAVAQDESQSIGHWVAAIPSGSGHDYTVFYGLGDVRNEGWSELIGHTSGYALLTSATAIDPGVARDFLLPRSFRPGMIAARFLVLLAAVVLAVAAFSAPSPANHRVQTHLIAGFLYRYGCRFVWQRSFVRGWPLAAIVACCAIAILPSNKPRILSISESAMLRGGAPAGCTDCYISGAPTQCGVGYEEFTCGEEPCPEDGDCSTEIAISPQNATKNTVTCQFGNQPIGNGGYTSKTIVCSYGLECAAACTRSPSGNMVCKNGPGDPGVIDSDQSENPDPAAPACRVTDWKPPPRLRYPDRLVVIANINGLSL